MKTCSCDSSAKSNACSCKHVLSCTLWVWLIYWAGLIIKQHQSKEGIIIITAWLCTIIGLYYCYVSLYNTVQCTVCHGDMSNFDERSGVVICQTPWGSWYQTIDEVFLEIVVNEGTRAKDISCNITSHSISLIVDKKTIIKAIKNNYNYYLHYIIARVSRDS